MGASATDADLPHMLKLIRVALARVPRIFVEQGCRTAKQILLLLIPVCPDALQRCAAWCVQLRTQGLAAAAAAAQWRSSQVICVWASLLSCCKLLQPYLGLFHSLEMLSMRLWLLLTCPLCFRQAEQPLLDCCNALLDLLRRHDYAAHQSLLRSTCQALTGGQPRSSTPASTHALAASHSCSTLWQLPELLQHCCLSRHGL